MAGLREKFAHCILCKLLPHTSHYTLCTKPAQQHASLCANNRETMPFVVYSCTGSAGLDGDPPANNKAKSDSNCKNLKIYQILTFFRILTLSVLSKISIEILRQMSTFSEEVKFDGSAKRLVQTKESKEQRQQNAHTKHMSPWKTRKTTLQGQEQ